MEASTFLIYAFFLENPHILLIENQVTRCNICGNKQQMGINYYAKNFAVCPTPILLRRTSEETLILHHCEITRNHHRQQGFVSG
jgi:late competence protein required for DNA uptake (superfamily II DNA/RNA helicase)